MYGWLCGIIRSKLAFSVSLRAAAQTQHQGQERADDEDDAPVVEHQPLEARAGLRVELFERAGGGRRGQGIVGGMHGGLVPSGQGEGLDAARTRDHQDARRRFGHRGRGHGALRGCGGEGRAGVAPTRTWPAWLASTMRPRASRVLAVRPTCRPVGTVCQLRPLSLLRSTVPRRPCTTIARSSPITPNSVPLYGSSSVREALAVALELERAALLADDVDRVADAAHRVEVQALRVVDRVHQRLPGLAAVARAQRQAEGADDVAVRRIAEPDVEQRVLGALRRVALGIVEQRRGALRVDAIGRATRRTRPAPCRRHGRRAGASRCGRRRRCAARRRRGRRPSRASRPGRTRRRGRSSPARRPAASACRRRPSTARGRAGRPRRCAGRRARAR